MLTLILVVPGIGMTSGPCARSHARAICPLVALCLAPIFPRASARARMFEKFSFEYLYMGEY